MPCSFIGGGIFCFKARAVYLALVRELIYVTIGLRHERSERRRPVLRKSLASVLAPSHILQHKLDRLGCTYNIPTAMEDNVFLSCLGDDQQPPGVYTSNGQGNGFYMLQPLATAHECFQWSRTRNLLNP